MFYRQKILFPLLIILAISCSKETTSPEKFGDMQGIVRQSESRKPIAGANITTTPATNSITSNKSGKFRLKNVPTGTYTVKAEKTGYKTASVDIEVQEGKAARVKVFLERDNSDIGAQEFKAKVNSFNGRTINSDSTYAEVEYSVQNLSENQNIKTYEVYFEISTSGPSFYYEVRDTSLAAGEQNIGDFEKFIKGNSINSVQVSDVYVSN